MLALDDMVESQARIRCGYGSKTLDEQTNQSDKENHAYYKFLGLDRVKLCVYQDVEYPNDCSQE
jgi:Zn ribbon nucleic-acid-binding protein